MVKVKLARWKKALIIVSSIILILVIVVMWGFSAGGRLTTNWSLSEEYSYKKTSIPAPTMGSIAYAKEDGENVIVDENTPAVYAIMGEKDEYYPKGSGIEATKKLIAKLDSAGIDTACDYYEGKNAVGHGFGRGDGTPAAGWMDRAIALWKSKLNG